MTDRIKLDDLTSDQLDALYEQLDQLRAVARGYCPACGRGDAAPGVEHWEQQKRRADQAEELLHIAHETSNRSEAERARAVQRAETAERDVRIYRDRLARLTDGYAEQFRRLEAAEAALARVRALHQPTGVVAAAEFGNPADCPTCGPNTWPCPTYLAVTEPEPVSGLAAAQAADGPTCRYCGADCSNGRSYDGGNRYACPDCARDRAAINRAGGRFDDLLFRITTAHASRTGDAIPRKHCGHLSPETGLTTPRTECVLRPGHSGSHADEVGCRWWYDPTLASKEQP